MSLKIAALSDLHGTLPELEPCELVLICGDVVSLNAQGSSRRTKAWYEGPFREWASSLNCRKVIFIAGNHELYFPDHYAEYASMFGDDDKVTYLCHESIEYEALDGKVYKIFGTPFCKEFGRWAFMLPNNELAEKFSEIPEGLDILITHDQPYQYGDILLQEDCYWADGSHIGNEQLTTAILEKKPKYQFNGHLHSCDHSKIFIGDTVHYNVSIKDEKYQPVYSPLYLEI